MVYELLIDAVKQVLRREHDFILDLEFFGEFAKRNGKLLFRSSDTVHIDDVYLRHEVRTKQAKRASFFKGLKRKKHQEISSMVFKLVNLPTLFEEEAEYYRAKELKSPRKARAKMKRSKTQVLRPIHPRNLKSPPPGRLLGSRGCLRSRKLAPLRFFKNNFTKRGSAAQQDLTKLTHESEVKVIEEFSRTLARPAGVVGECLSVSGRIASNYTPLSRYLHVDFEKKNIRFFKLEDDHENQDPNQNKDSLEPYLKELKINITSNCGLDMDLFPTREEIDMFHRLQLKNQQLVRQKVTDQAPGEDTMIMLEEHDRNKLEILRLKAKNHREMLEKYRALVSSEIPQKVVFPISNQFLEDIFARVEINLKSANKKYFELEVDRLVAEIKRDYYWNIKKAVLDYVLKDRKQQRRLGIKLIDFSDLREWGEKDADCVVRNEDKRVEKLADPSQMRHSVLIKSEVKNVLKSRFSIINDGKMRKSTFSMLNRKNQGFDFQNMMRHQNSSQSNQVRLSNFRRPSKYNKDSTGALPNMNISSPKHKQKSKAKASESRSLRSDTRALESTPVFRENFQTKIQKLDRKLLLFKPAMKEIKTIRAYFKYSFDLRDQIIQKKDFDMDYKSIDQLLCLPEERLTLDWAHFVSNNLDRLEKFKTIVIPSWMQEITNVYQKSILGKVSKPMAIRFFDHVAGILSMDMRELVLTCLGKLSGFFQQFGKLVLSPREAIDNVSCDEAVMPKSFFKVQVELITRPLDLQM